MNRDCKFPFAPGVITMASRKGVLHAVLDVLRRWFHLLGGR